VLLGDGGVGKSCLTIQLTQAQFVHEYDPTIENSYRKQVEVDGAVCVMDILDTAGQEEYRVLQDQYIHRGEGFLIIYSVTSRASFELVTKFQQKIFMVKDEDEYFPMVIVGNKCDLDDQREVTPEEGLELAKTIGAPFFETSAKTRVNVEAAFMECVREIRRRRTQEDGGGPAPAATSKDAAAAKSPEQTKKKEAKRRTPCTLI